MGSLTAVEEETADIETGGLTEAERRAQAEGRKKHSRPIVTMEVDGQTVLAEKVWGSALFPSDVVKDFTQYCRDTGVKPTTILEDIIRKGLAPVFEEVQATKADRDRARMARKAVKKGEDPETRVKKLLALEAKLAALKEAAKADFARLRENGDKGAVDALAAILGLEDEAEPVAVPAKNGRKK